MPPVRAVQLMNKRLLGFFNWHRRRKSFHLRTVADLLVKDLKDQQPDHVAVTGDLVNISLRPEFENALEWLRTIGSGEHVSVVPGNHDAYVAMPWDETLGVWSDYMRSDTLGAAHVAPGERFPYIRIAGGIAIIGLSTGVPMPPLLASGRLGEEQRTALDKALATLGAEGYFRVVLIHHPPLAHQASRRKGLRDATELAGILERNGAELVLHGHNHRDMHETLTTRRGVTHIYGVPSASGCQGGHRPAAQYNLYDIERDGGEWRCRVTVRGLAADGRSFTPAGETTFTAPAKF